MCRRAMGLFGRCNSSAANRRRRDNPTAARRLLLPAAGVFLGLAAATDYPLGEWRRAAETPILSPQGTTWESAGTFNPAVAGYAGKFVMLYRAQDAAGTSRLGYAEGRDGIHFNRRAEPVLSPEAEYEKGGGVEDPRLQKFGNTFYL